ncbi:MAG: ATP-binding protein [Promethearchaeota archaeon]|jgi:ferredoxin/predicted transcriptional regulator
MTEAQDDYKVKTENKVYRKLQQSLDKLPINFPATESGVELRILKHLFSPEKALVATRLGFMPRSLKEIHIELEKEEISLELVEKYLDELYGEGLIRRSIRKMDEESIKFYTAAPLVIGFYEFQLNRLTEDFVRDVDQYFEEKFMEVVNKTKIPQLRTIPVEQSIGIERNIATYDEIKAIFEDCGDLIVLNKCICREKHDMIGERCKKTDLRETCFSFRSLAESYQNLGLGRRISKGEALEILDELQEAGVVIQPGNAVRPLGICCCCGCCCDILVHQKKFDSPAELFATNYYAQVDVNACIGCGTCETRCNMDAVHLVDDISTIDLSRCVGCGVCSSTCPEEAITLVKKQKEIVPPANGFETYKVIAKERARLEKLEKKTNF